jgi:hypothetical protein
MSNFLVVFLVANERSELADTKKTLKKIANKGVLLFFLSFGGFLSFFSYFKPKF